MKFSTNMLNYSKKDRTFSQEISVLEHTIHRGNVFHQVYPDACDEGITLVSTQTGQEVDYVVTSVDQNQEGEIAGWWLKPTAQSIRRVPACRNTHVLIIND